MARSLADVKKAHAVPDYATKFRDALRGIPKGKYETTQELANRVGISTKHIAPFYDTFDAHRVVVKDRASRPQYLWARTPATAKKLRDGLKSQNG